MEDPATLPEPRAAADGARPAGGVQAVLRCLAAAPGAPGVYRMRDAGDRLLYVGKARNLKRRLVAYTHPFRLPTRIARMVAETARVEITTTHTEVEALLLEANLIKRHRPRYNISLRDDKSFPYILITGDHAWPQILKHRGARARAGQYFGPFASAGAVNRTLAVLQRAFPLRSCSDSVFESRTRPCLQYQIKRCTGPCCGLIPAADYAQLVDQGRRFLDGRGQEVQDLLGQRMEEASATLQFEAAAVYRDRIRALSHVLLQQDINVASLPEADVIAAYAEAGRCCVQVFFFRAGQSLGNRAYFPSHASATPIAEVLAAFLGQFYQDKSVPPLILLSHAPDEAALIARALTLHAGHRVRLHVPERGDKHRIVEHAVANARLALGQRLAESATLRQLREGLARHFALAGPPERIEIYDNSHISGTDAIGAMVVAGPEGYVKRAYRKFTIRGTDMSPGDDYAMLREVLARRFSRLLREDPDRAGESWPDLVLIDGGAGQLGVAAAVFADLGVAGVALAAIAKGPDRDAGRERLFLPGREPFRLAADDPVLYYLQRLRDEAHRFAIGTHRAKRGKSGLRSALDEIPGVGGQRKRSLLHHFGSARDVAQAGLADLEAVPGISRTVARRVYQHFHAGV